MWLFKNKAKLARENNEDLKQKAYKEIADFREIGKRFYYLGVEMIVTGHRDIIFAGYNISCIPCIKADYVNKHGEIKQIQFYYKELDNLIAENI